MKVSAPAYFHSSATAQLLRPWVKERSNQLFYGQRKSGSKRHALTTKQGNKTFYKGTRSSGIGKHTPGGNYYITWSKVRTYVPPSSENYNHDLKPLVPKYNFTKVSSNSYKGFKNSLDSNLYYKKLSDYIFYGKEINPNDPELPEWLEHP
ncbi:mitochondrial 54S ribosomal protein mL41 MRPL27 ASCRUDRAFT_58787 [Ascoidea rubescens DSM 1968]|uniref:Uncharacterized protein n=1 Tax=Ascoidea rubescens DSM 1968 TaxID=1344418 RepID=A0A1D2VFH5_9ASCO|nr:hypothetical protein ASCRUDRAFT_58787 [Ascoidea rubescens DSM 1968]ODV60270.1 hypothetical protein ASCRUDRAFT_58787 [Ascoidea rubescens DSM 1968]